MTNKKVLKIEKGKFLPLGRGGAHLGLRRHYVTYLLSDLIQQAFTD